MKEPMSTDAIDRAIKELPLLTRAQVLVEAEYDPQFWTYFAPLALSRSPGRAVDEDMTKALINEMDPTRFPETAQHWPRLREHFRWTLGLLRSESAAGRIGMSGMEDLGQDVWSSIASIVSSVGKAATNVYLQTLQNKIIKAQQEAEARLQQQQLQQAQAQAQAAAAAAASVPGAPGVPGAPTVRPAEGFPSWIIYALLAAAGVAGIFFVTRRLKGGG